MISKKNTFTAQSISRPYILALISVIIFFGFGLYILRIKELHIRTNISQDVYTEYVLENKKDYIKTTIDREIQHLRQTYKFYESNLDSSTLHSENFQKLIKNQALEQLKQLELKPGGYIWVIEVLNYKGGANYAIQRYNPSKPDKNGKFLTTEEHDKNGIYFYSLMLDIVNGKRGHFFTYDYPKLGLDSISKKISYVKLFKQYNWIIGTGIHLDEIESYTLRSKTAFNKRFSFYKKTTLFYLILIFLLTALIAYLHKKRIDNLIGYYISKVREKEQELTRFNNQLEITISERTKDLVASNVALEKAMLVAEESNKLKTAFLANMSHEVRTPLNSILGFSELLADSRNTPDQINSYVSFIQKSGQQLLNTINDILDISRLESNQLKIEKQKVSLNEIMKEVYDLGSELCKNEDVSYTLLSPNTRDNIFFNNDPLRFKQVFLKLINNAHKFTAKGNVTIGYTLIEHDTEKQLLFFVKDTGIGISADQHHLIFKHFSQAVDAEYRQGNGIGLSISKGLISLMGGDIWFISNKGKGSTFYFSLPLQ